MSAAREDKKEESKGINNPAALYKQAVELFPAIAKDRSRDQEMEAFALLKKAVELDYPPACFHLGKLYFDAVTNDLAFISSYFSELKNEKTFEENGIEMLLKAAKKDFAPALCLLGYIYNPLPIPSYNSDYENAIPFLPAMKDANKAFDFFKKANECAALEDKDENNSLYKLNISDTKRLRELLRQAELGEVNAQFEVASLYEQACFKETRKEKIDFYKTEFFRWTCAAANQGHVIALNNAAKSYLPSYKDHRTIVAVNHFKKTKDKLFDCSDPQKGLDYLQKAVAAGCSEAMYHMASIYNPYEPFHHRLDKREYEPFSDLELNLRNENGDESAILALKLLMKLKNKLPNPATIKTFDIKLDEYAFYALGFLSHSMSLSPICKNLENYYQECHLSRDPGDPELLSKLLEFKTPFFGLKEISAEVRETLAGQLVREASRSILFGARTTNELCNAFLSLINHIPQKDTLYFGMFMILVVYRRKSYRFKSLRDCLKEEDKNHLAFYEECIRIIKSNPLAVQGWLIDIYNAEAFDPTNKEEKRYSHFYEKEMAGLDNPQKVFFSTKRLETFLRLLVEEPEVPKIIIDAFAVLTNRTLSQGITTIAENMQIGTGLKGIATLVGDYAYNNPCLLFAQDSRAKEIMMLPEEKESLEKTPCTTATVIKLSA